MNKKEYMKEYRQRPENKAKLKTYQKKQYEKNREKNLKYAKDYREKNKDLIKIKMKEKYWKNPEKYRNEALERWKKDPEKGKEKCKQYYLNNSKKEIERAKKYHRKNRDAVLKTKSIYRLNNKDKINKYNQAYQKNRKKVDVIFKVSTNLRKALTKALNRYTKNGKINNSKFYGIDFKGIIEHLKPFPKNSHLYEVDHIKPLCSFEFVTEDGSTNLEEVKKAFAPENHQWLTIQENRSKGGRIKC